LKLTDFNITLIDKSNFTQVALLMSWRSNPDIYKYFFLQNKALIWEDHLDFINKSYDRVDYFVFFEDRPIGHIALSRIEEMYPEISIMIGETTLWGKGYSKHILNKFLENHFEKGFSKFSARISNHNTSSIRLFTNAGFVYQGQSEDNKEWGYYYFDSNLEGNKL